MAIVAVATAVVAFIVRLVVAAVDSILPGKIVVGAAVTKVVVVVVVVVVVLSCTATAAVAVAFLVVLVDATPVVVKERGMVVRVALVVAVEQSPSPEWQSGTTS